MIEVIRYLPATCEGIETARERVADAEGVVAVDFVKNFHFDGGYASLEYWCPKGECADPVKLKEWMPTPQGTIFAKMHDGKTRPVACLNFESWEDCLAFQLPESCTNAR